MDSTVSASPIRVNGNMIAIGIIGICAKGRVSEGIKLNNEAFGHTVIANTAAVTGCNYLALRLDGKRKTVGAIYTGIGNAEFKNGLEAVGESLLGSIPRTARLTTWCSRR